MLVRIELYRIGLLDKTIIEDKVAKILDKLKSKIDFSFMTYSLCHGIASIIELMISIQLISENKSDCKEILDNLIVEEMSNFRNGYGNNVDIDSFMNGRMGKIYAVLRTCLPKIPSFPLLKFNVY